MDGKRVEEIMQSYGVINVNYNGKPVWIEGIKGELADISPIGTDRDRTISVPISSLVEVDPIQQK